MVENEKSIKIKPAKKKRRNKSDLGDNFVPPEGGWGWFVSIASGVNMLVAFALAQQFGIVFRDHMNKLGITSSKLTSIINIQIAITALTGLLNGPLFRRYSFRQVALFGSFLTFFGLFTCAFADSFLSYCLSYSICYGIGRRLTVSASALAVNTYFKKKRRTAASYQFGVAGLGPICLPYVATFLLDYMGVQGTVLFFASLSLNTMACALIYQPVKWHVKEQAKDAEASKKLTAGTDEDEHIIAQLVEPETPVLPRANERWFGSKTSLTLLSDAEAAGKLTTGTDKADHTIQQPIEPETPKLPQASDGRFGSKTSLTPLSDVEASKKLTTDTDKADHTIQQPKELDKTVLPGANDGWFGSKTSLTLLPDAEALGKLTTDTNKADHTIQQPIEPETPKLPQANDGRFGSSLTLLSDAEAAGKLTTGTDKADDIIKKPREPETPVGSKTSLTPIFDAEASKKLTTGTEKADHTIQQPREPETPILPQANDGCYGSKSSLTSVSSTRNELGSLEKCQRSDEIQMNTSLKRSVSRGSTKQRSVSLSHSSKEERNEKNENDDHNELQQLREKDKETFLAAEKEESRKKLSWYMKVVIFFDLDMLRDFAYVNLAVGLSLINFVELNFAILTPFILADLGFEKHEIAFAMSLLGVFDLILRFLIPVITAKINLSNKTFLMLGLLGMCVGRIILSFTTNFYVMIGIFVWLGLNKAFRTIFWALIMPGYVPLKKLPAASGLQLLMSGLFSLAFGPLIGLIRDYTNYACALNFLNALSLLAIGCWVLESFVRKHRNKSRVVTEDLK